MRKSVTKIVKAVLGFTMAIGAFVGAAMSNYSVNKVVAATEIETDTYNMSDAIGSSYGKYENSDFIVTCGGGNSSVGINNNSSNWSKFNLGSYSKYAVSPITTSDYATAVVMKISTTDVVNMTFAYTAGTNANKGHIYAIYSSDNATYSQLTITSGTAQNASMTTTSGTFQFNFGKCTGYFGIVIVKDASLAANSNLKYTNATLTLGREVVSSFGTLDHIKIATSASKTNFEVGDAFSSAGLVLTGYDGENEASANTQTYDSGFTTDLDNHVFVPSDRGNNKSVTVTYEGKTTTYTINVTGGDALLNYDNSPFGDATAASSTAKTFTIDGIQYENKYGYNYNTNKSIEFGKNTNAYLGNKTGYTNDISSIVLIWQKYNNSSEIDVYECAASLSTVGATEITPVDDDLKSTYTFSGDNNYFKICVNSTEHYMEFKGIVLFFGNIHSEVDTVSATVVDKTYYTGTTLSSSDFNLVVTWTGEKPDSNPTEGFTWKVNGVLNGELEEGNNAVVVTYGGVDSDPINVVATTMHATGVSITEVSASVDVGGTVALEGAVIPAGAVDEIVWSSDDESIATVNSSGVVTGVSVGTVTITATANGYTDTCLVSVCSTIDLSDKSFVVTKPASAQTEPSTALIGSHTLNLINAYNKKDSTTYTYMMFGNKELKTSDSLISNKTPISGPITKIIFTIKAGSSGSAVYKAMLSSTEVTSPVTSATYTRTGAGTIEITSDAANDLRYFAISSTNSSANGQLENVKICYEQPTAEGAINNVNTRSALAYKYTAEPLAITAAAIRFGGLISKTAWDRLDDEQEIQGYGILLSTSSFLGANELKTKYNAVDGTNVKKFDHAVAVLPDEANVEQTNGLLETHYVWNLFKNVPLDQLTTEYVAVAYIRTASGVVFLGQAAASVDDLADAMLASDEYDDASFGGSLKYLSELN